jgi:hypothetical protein
MKHLFSERAGETLARCMAVFEERGEQYGDTWRANQWLAAKATAKHLGLAIPDSAWRALAAAVLVDTKYTRLLAGYKEDSIDDGINYAAFLAAELRAAA